MCTLAGYIGTKQAAPILIEMLRREEALNGGCYTGIATFHEGKIYSAKLTGDLDRLLAETDAANLPGTVGIIHSRTPSGGGDAWAHPFLGCRAGEARIAYIANGDRGYFAPRRDSYDQVAEMLLAEGYTFSSRDSSKVEGYQTFSDGSTVHDSDVMCQLILREMDRGAEEADAMARAFGLMPSEIVGLMLSVRKPDRIFWSRINMPMNAAFAPHGAYLATAALALPSDAEEPQLLAPCASGWLSRDRLFTAPFAEKPAGIAPIDARTTHEAYAILCAALCEEEQTFPSLTGKIRSVFAPADCDQAGALTYEILYALHRAGALKSEIRRKPGARPELDAPVCYMRLDAAKEE